MFLFVLFCFVLAVNDLRLAVFRVIVSCSGSRPEIILDRIFLRSRQVGSVMFLHFFFFFCFMDHVVQIQI